LQLAALGLRVGEVQREPRATGHLCRGTLSGFILAAWCFRCASGKLPISGY